MTLNNQLEEGTTIITARELGVDPEALWQTADKLRGSIDAAEYKHVVMGLIFLKFISDAFEAHRATLADKLVAEGIAGERAERLLEDRDEYTAGGGLLGTAGGQAEQYSGPGQAAKHRHAHCRRDVRHRA